MFDAIRERVSDGELLAQLAEECAELSQAALKLRRVITPAASPTPVSLAQAQADLREEAADVLLCLLSLGDGYLTETTDESAWNVSATPHITCIMEKKLRRWRERCENG